MRLSWLICRSILGAASKRQTSGIRYQKQIKLFLFCAAFTLFLAPVSLPKVVAQPAPVAASERPILRTGSRGAVVSELQAVLKLMGYYTGNVDGIYGDSTAIAVTRFQEAAGINADGIVGRATWERLFSESSTSETTASTQAPSSLPPSRTTASTETPSSSSTTSAEAPSSLPPSRTTAAASAQPSATTSQAATRGSETTASQPSIGDLPTLRLGMRGPEVFWLQTRLRTTGYFKGTVDGIFGEATEVAVKAAQQNYGLNADGIVGPSTWRAILP